MNSHDALTMLCGALPDASARPFAPFSEPVLRFLEALSSALMRDREARAFPDVATFAFFCRRANLQRLLRGYEGRLSGRVGRGLTFHIAPGNVPVNFAYSLTTSLLAGNANVVKASSRDFEQTRAICRAADALLAGEHQALRRYACVVSYPKEERALTEAFSAACDVRVIWGGDETVRRVREIPLAPRAVDVAFADRYSLMCARAEAVLALDDAGLQRVAEGFYNDTFLTDQNACTAPTLVYWVGGEDEVCRARRRFWSAAHAYASARYEVEPVTAVDKLTMACRAAIELAGARLESMPDNLITRVSVGELARGVEAYRCAGGFFVEYQNTSLSALPAIVTPKYQTLSYLGFEPEALGALVIENGLRGIDRIVPVGHTMDFSLTWDGYDLICTLSRRMDTM